MHVYVTQANFTTKPRFEIKNKRSFTEMNSQGSRVEKNTHAQNVQMQNILFTNEAWIRIRIRIRIRILR